MSTPAVTLVVLSYTGSLSMVQYVEKSFTAPLVLLIPDTGLEAPLLVPIGGGVTFGRIDFILDGSISSYVESKVYILAFLGDSGSCWKVVVPYCGLSATVEAAVRITSPVLSRVTAEGGSVL